MINEFSNQTQESQARRPGSLWLAECADAIEEPKADGVNLVALGELDDRILEATLGQLGEGQRHADLIASKIATYAVGYIPCGISRVGQ